MSNKPLEFLLQPLAQLCGHDSAMEVPTAMVFVWVALHPGIKITVIRRELNLTRWGAHRHISLLTEEGDFGRRGAHTRGLGLVMRKRDPKDGRAKRLYLTAKGQAFAQSLVESVS